MHIHHIQGYMQDMYLFEYPDKLLLMDAGCSCDVPMILNFITKTLGRKLTELKVVIVSHIHPDHVGGAHKLRKLTGCKIVSGQAKGHWYGGMSGLTSYAIDICLAHIVAGKMKKPHQSISFNPFFKADVYLNDQETIPHFPDWQVLKTIGHTDRDITLYHAGKKIAYTADLIIKTRRGYISPFPIYFPEQYRNSLALIKSLQLSKTLLAHGGIVQTTGNDIDELIKNSPKKPLYFRGKIEQTIKKKLKLHSE